MAGIFLGYPNDKILGFLRKSLKKLIRILPKNDVQGFDLQEKEIVRVLDNPKIEVNNSNIKDINNTFTQIKTTFPISGDLEEPKNLRELHNVMDTYIVEKNKTF